MQITSSEESKKAGAVVAECSKCSSAYLLMKVL